MKIVVAFNDDLALKPHLNEFERAGDAEVADTAQEIAQITGGTLMPVREVAPALEQLRLDRPEVVINLCEGVAGRPAWEMNFALALEMLAIPFTGCDPIATGICGDKALTKKLLTSAGIRTPRGVAVTSVRDVPAIEGRWIVKPSREDAGIGIEPAAVCDGREQIAQRVAHVVATYDQPALIEEFIDGREINQALYEGREGLVVLPPGEIIFAEGLSPGERVVGWKAKWAPGSPEDRATVNRTPCVMDDTTRGDVADICAEAASVLSLRGYCRFDLRQGPAGELWIIDINPNPDIGRDTGFRKALTAAGVEFADFLNEIMISALSRRNR